MQQAPNPCGRPKLMQQAPNPRGRPQAFCSSSWGKIFTGTQVMEICVKGRLCLHLEFFKILAFRAMFYIKAKHVFLSKLGVKEM